MDLKRIMITRKNSSKIDNMSINKRIIFMEKNIMIITNTMKLSLIISKSILMILAVKKLKNNNIKGKLQIR